MKFVVEFFPPKKEKRKKVEKWKETEEIDSILLLSRSWKCQHCALRAT